MISVGERWYFLLFFHWQGGKIMVEGEGAFPPPQEGKTMVGCGVAFSPPDGKNAGERGGCIFPPGKKMIFPYEEES